MVNPVPFVVQKVTERTDHYPERKPRSDNLFASSEAHAHSATTQSLPVAEPPTPHHISALRRQPFKSYRIKPSSEPSAQPIHTEPTHARKEPQPCLNSNPTSRRYQPPTIWSLVPRKRLILTRHTLQYLDKRVEVQMNGARKVQGTMRGYDVRLPR